MSIPRIETDLLIVGTGFAGLWAAISAREAGVERVALVDKASIAMSSQSRLCAGATIYCLPEDDAEVWLRDIVEANGFLSRQPLVEEILKTSGARLRKLEEWGVRYPQSAEGGYLRIPSRGFRHAKMMVMPRYRDRVGGSAVADAVRRRAIRGGVSRHPRLLISDLLQRDGRIVGALALDRTTAEPRLFAARAVLLATADCSFRGNYVCTDGTTGDGFQLARKLRLHGRHDRRRISAGLRPGRATLEHGVSLHQHGIAALRLRGYGGSAQVGRTVAQRTARKLHGELPSRCQRSGDSRVGTSYGP